MKRSCAACGLPLVRGQADAIVCENPNCARSVAMTRTTMKPERLSDQKALDGFSFAVGVEDGRRAARQHLAGHRGTSFRPTRRINTVANPESYWHGWYAGWHQHVEPKETNSC